MANGRRFEPLTTAAISSACAPRLSVSTLISPSRVCHPPDRPPACSLARPPVHPFVHLPPTAVRKSAHPPARTVRQSAGQPSRTPARPFARPSVRTSTRSPVRHPPVFLLVHPLNRPSVRPPVLTPVRLSVNLPARPFISAIYQSTFCTPECRLTVYGLYWIASSASNADNDRSNRL